MTKEEDEWKELLIHTLLLYFFAALGIKLRAPCVRGKRATVELQPEPLPDFDIFSFRLWCLLLPTTSHFSPKSPVAPVPPTIPGFNVVINGGVELLLLHQVVPPRLLQSHHLCGEG